MRRTSFSRLVPRGLTLIELVVVMGIFSIAMGLVAFLFSSTVRYMRVSDERVDTKESRIKLATVLNDAIMSSHQDGNTLFYQGPSPSSGSLVVSFISTRDTLGQAGWDPLLQCPIYRGYRIFYVDETTKELKVATVTIAETTTPQSLAKADILTKIQPTTDRVLARSVVAFRLVSTVDATPLATWSNLAILQLTQETSRGTPIVTEVPFRLALY